MKLKTVKSIFPDATDEQLDSLLTAVQEETGRLTKRVQELENASGKDEWKDRYDALKAEYDKYKNGVETEKTNADKKAALKELLKDDLSEKGLEKALKYADLDSIELTDKGAIVGAAKLLAGMKEEWSDYVTTEDTAGADTSGRDHGTGGAGGNGGGGAKMTVEEIYKITDPIERQAAIAKNLDLF